MPKSKGKKRGKKKDRLKAIQKVVLRMEKRLEELGQKIDACCPETQQSSEAAALGPAAGQAAPAPHDGADANNDD